jgi:hypothetical protein
LMNGKDRIAGPLRLIGHHPVRIYRNQFWSG